MSEKIIAYKGMDENMRCRGKQYEVGKTYTENKAECCHAGMHACVNPLDVFRYYRLDGKNRFFEVECSGDVSKDDCGSKLACTELTIKGEMNFAGLVKATVQAVFDRIKEKSSFSSGDSSTAGTSGDSSTAATSGNRSTAATSGYYSTVATSGNRSTAATSGDYSTAGTSGYYSTAATSGDSSTAGTSGYYSTAGTSGYYSTAATSGDYSTAATSGNRSTAATSGDSSTAVATGSFCRAESTGAASIAVANGYESKARGAMGDYLVLTEYDSNLNLVCAKMAQVDGDQIKPHVWYILKNGEVVEA